MKVEPYADCDSDVDRHRGPLGVLVGLDDARLNSSVSCASVLRGGGSDACAGVFARLRHESAARATAMQLSAERTTLIEWVGRNRRDPLRQSESAARDR